MKHLKTLGLAAFAATALMAFAVSSASATMLYDGSTTLGVGYELDFSLKSGTKTTLTQTSGEPLNECSTATIKAKITNAGSATSTVSASISSLGWVFGACTFAIGPTVNGALEFHQIGTGTNATVTASVGFSWSFETILFGSCTYGAESGFDIGTLTTASSGTAVLDISAVMKKLTGSNIACPETSNWRATFISTTPDNLRVEAS